MNKAFLSGVSIGALAIASSAQAADLGARPIYKAPPVAPAPWSWTGFYLGANVGGAHARSSVTDPTTFFTGGTLNADKTGVIGGFQLGYNWQISNVVVGLEGDVSFADLNRSATYFFTNYSSRLSALGTVRGRIGYAFDRFLVYGTGGVAFADLKDTLTNPIFTGPVTPSSTRTGWTAGGGLEFAFADHWTAKAEYLHVGFGSKSGTGMSFFTPYTFTFKDSLDIGRVGINYKF